MYAYQMLNAILACISDCVSTPAHISQHRLLHNREWDEAGRDPDSSFIQNPSVATLAVILSVLANCDSRIGQMPEFNRSRNDPGVNRTKPKTGNHSCTVWCSPFGVIFLFKLCHVFILGGHHRKSVGILSHPGYKTTCIRHLDIIR